MIHDRVMLSFMWQNSELYSCWAFAVPRVDDFIRLNTIMHPMRGHLEGVFRFRVCAVESTFYFEMGRGEVPQEVYVHLRRLHIHEWENRHESSGYGYEEMG